MESQTFLLLAVASIYIKYGSSCIRFYHQMPLDLPIKLLDLQGAILSEITSSIPSANATFVYAVQWREGATFDLSKSAVKVHRARLRKLGIDIAKPYGGELLSIRDISN